MTLGTQWITSIFTASLAFGLIGCKKPQLQSERDDPLPGDKKVIESVEPGLIDEKRKSVIGQVYQSLSLGSKRFVFAEIRDIDDERIVVAHADGVDEASWDDVPDEVREQWGYNPAAKLMKNKVADTLSGLIKTPKIKDDPAAKIENSFPDKASNLGAADRTRQIALKEQMLEAQLAGIRNLESDFSRHSTILNTLRAEWRSVRAMQSAQRSGGVRVERIGGETTVVDRKMQARDLEAKIKVEEQMVAQLTKSIQAARKTYQDLQLEVIQLRQR
ncbi:hypothetical protein N9B73_13270 [Verrucomicrobiales bacterium]|nr:hypothetical protein [Verrucomicrobiales bacterium]